MPNKRVSEKEIVVSTPIPARHKPANTKRAKRPVSAPAEEAVTQATAIVPSREEVAALAYSYWEARGYQGGSPEEDWLRAEQELAAKPLASTAIA
jgi:hypothetical protein